MLYDATRYLLVFLSHNENAVCRIMFSCITFHVFLYYFPCFLVLLSMFCCVTFHPIYLCKYPNEFVNRFLGIKRQGFFCFLFFLSVPCSGLNNNRLNYVESCIYFPVKFTISIYSFNLNSTNHCRAIYFFTLTSHQNVPEFSLSFPRSVS